MSQKGLGAGPALVLVEDTVLHRHLHIVQEDVVDLMTTFQGRDPADFNAR